MHRQVRNNHAEPKGVWVLYVFAGFLGLACLTLLGTAVDKQDRYYAMKYAPQPELISALKADTLARQGHHQGR